MYNKRTLFVEEILHVIFDECDYLAEKLLHDDNDDDDDNEYSKIRLTQYSDGSNEVLPENTTKQWVIQYKNPIL